MLRLTQSTKGQTEKEIKRAWHLVDVKDQVLGRVVSSIIQPLSGASKSNYAPYLDQGDYVVVINAKNVKLTGKKTQQKVYTYYSGYPGGQKVKTAADLKNTNPAELIRHAVTGMLPKNKLRKKRLGRLYIYEGAQHPYADRFK